MIASTSERSMFSSGQPSPLKPGMWMRGVGPSNSMMLVFRPLKPRAATSAPARSTSASERIGSKPVHDLIRSAKLTRQVPQCDQ